MSGYSLKAPPFYHDKSMRIEMDPVKVHGMAQSILKVQLGWIADGWTRIGAAMDSLTIGWAGAGAQEAQAFFAELRSAQADMFGIKEEQDSRTDVTKAGILPLLRLSAAHAATNFGKAEDDVAKMCNTFADAVKPDDPLDPNGRYGHKQTPPGSKEEGPQSDPDGPVAVRYGQA